MGYATREAPRPAMPSEKTTIDNQEELEHAQLLLSLKGNAEANAQDTNGTATSPRPCLGDYRAAFSKYQHDADVKWKKINELKDKLDASFDSETLAQCIDLIREVEVITDSVTRLRKEWLKKNNPDAIVHQ